MWHPTWMFLVISECQGSTRTQLGISNGLIQLKSARKIWPFRAKITRVLACSRSQNFCNCLHVRILVNLRSIPWNFINPQKNAWSQVINKYPKDFILLILFLLFPSVDSLSLLEASLTIVVSLNSFSSILLNDLNSLSLEKENVTVTRSIYQEIQV